jgi:hypothetical protein
MSPGWAALMNASRRRCCSAELTGARRPSATCCRAGHESTSVGFLESKNVRDFAVGVVERFPKNVRSSFRRRELENKVPLFALLGVAIPTAVSAFPDELYQAPRH